MLSLESKRKKIELAQMIFFLIQEYHTDEEKPVKETKWIRNKWASRVEKKRKAECSPEIEKTDDTLPVKKVELKKFGGAKEKQPPPINIVGIKDYASIRALLNTNNDRITKLASLNNDVWKINTQDSDTYRSLATKLNEKGYQWYTYEEKKDRPIKVMARGLHTTCIKEEILEELQQNAKLKIIDAVNIIKKERKVDTDGKPIVCKKGLPLFMLTFDNKEDVEKIYNIKSILHMRVKIEPLRKTSNLIPQCKNCQGFNTTKYCHREPRCVKCTGEHHTIQCKINKDTPPKCVNCGGQHPANYRGCEVAKELQNIRNRINNSQQRYRKQAEKSESLTQMVQKPQESKVTESSRTFSQVSQSKPLEGKPKEESNLLERILRRLEAIEKHLDSNDKKLEDVFMNLADINSYFR
jgi:hypothetical protein